MLFFSFILLCLFIDMVIDSEVQQLFIGLESYHMAHMSWTVFDPHSMILVFMFWQLLSVSILCSGRFNGIGNKTVKKKKEMSKKKREKKTNKSSKHASGSQ